MKKRRFNASLPELDEPPSPHALDGRLTQLKVTKDHCEAERQRLSAEIEGHDRFLALEPKVSQAIKELSEQVFHETFGRVAEYLSLALQEVLAQDLSLKIEAKPDGRSGQKVSFAIIREGNEENILRGQGGSVANVLSVGLRLFALRHLDPAEHRPVLILDEPDAWIRPELVPRLMRMIHQASQELGVQVVVITHHDLDLVRHHADRVVELNPQPDGSVQTRVN